jgi:hypothetical protein
MILFFLNGDDTYPMDIIGYYELGKANTPSVLQKIFQIY